MFDIFFKNSPGRILMKYANDIGYLYKNLEKIEDLNYDDARKNLRQLYLYFKNEVLENPNMDKIDITFKCMIPEMYAFKRVTVGYSMSELNIFLYQLAEKYDLKEEFFK